jgi:hypothetical protein
MVDRDERAEGAERTEWPKDRQSIVETARKIWCRSAERGRRAGNVTAGNGKPFYLVYNADIAAVHGIQRDVASGKLCRT